MAQGVDVPASTSFASEAGGDLYQQTTSADADIDNTSCAGSSVASLFADSAAPPDLCETPTSAYAMLAPEDKLAAYEVVCAEAIENEDWDTLVRCSIFNTALAKMIHADDSSHIEIGRTHWKLADAYARKGLARQAEVHANRVVSMTRALFAVAEEEADATAVRDLLLKALHTRNVAYLQQSKTSKEVVASLEKEFSFMREMRLHRSEQGLCVLRDLGAVYLSRDQTNEALTCFGRARKLTSKVRATVGDDASAENLFTFLATLGELSYECRGFDLALHSLEDAISLGQTLELADTLLDQQDDSGQLTAYDFARPLLRYGEIALAWLCCGDESMLPQGDTLQEIEQKVSQRLVAAQNLLKQCATKKSVSDRTKVRVALCRLHVCVDDLARAKNLLKKDLATLESTAPTTSTPSRPRARPTPSKRRPHATGQSRFRSGQGLDPIETTLAASKTDSNSRKPLSHSMRRQILELHGDVLALSGELDEARRAFKRALEFCTSDTRRTCLRERIKDCSGIDTAGFDFEVQTEYLRNRFGYPPLAHVREDGPEKQNPNISPAKRNSHDKTSGKAGAADARRKTPIRAVSTPHNFGHFAHGAQRDDRVQRAGTRAEEVGGETECVTGAGGHVDGLETVRSNSTNESGTEGEGVDSESTIESGGSMYRSHRTTVTVSTAAPSLDADLAQDLNLPLRFPAWD